jgi:hypothetical protein
MRIFTYFESLASLNVEDNLRLVNLWRRHHQALGYTPIVLQEWHARSSPMFQDFDARICALPSINPAGYDRACYLRWLAMTKTGGGIMMDFDVMLYVKPEALFLLIDQYRGKGLAVLQNFVPSMVMGQELDYSNQCKRFADYRPDERDVHNGKPHTSDMIILERQALREPDSFTRVDLVKLFGEDGWNDAPAVHYANQAMAPKNLLPRWKQIPELRK